jgi:hypothetical protein
MRGFFAVVGGPKPRFDILREARLQGIAFVEAVNAEVGSSQCGPATGTGLRANPSDTRCNRCAPDGPPVLSPGA